MKTLCFTLGMLLLTVCWCNAMPQAVHFSTAPRHSTAPHTCCPKVSNKTLPFKRVTSITVTHSSCPEQAFIVQTVKGRKICYEHNSTWAQDVYNRLN
ncbi:unnamed protein product [Pleuronectes platessa]|uniref:Chemokine interleukin-8-like domain-containing protein n=1 Tax=Pleuronectes platessa TaxID=8262 RepID=A0A9N7VV57_PLEPL|nr:unnamed protein product [Pleuronectes platessa]